MAFNQLDIAKLESRVDRVRASPDRFTVGDLMFLIDDLRAAIKPSKSVAIQLMEQEIERLKVREQSLLETNTAYLLRAREAEGELLRQRQGVQGAHGADVGRS